MNRSTQLEVLQELYRLESKQNGADSAAIKKLEESLDPSLLKRYLKLKQRKGTAVAVLSNGICSGCNMTYPDTHEVLRYENFVNTCEFCGRFLLINGNNPESVGSNTKFAPTGAPDHLRKG